MRILHVTHQYPPEFVGGVEVYTQTLAQLQVQQGHSVAIFTRGTTDGRASKIESTDGLLIHTTSGDGLSANQRFMATFGWSKQDAAIVQHFATVLDEFRPDAIHIQHMMGLPIRCIDLIVERNIPFVITLWDFWWVCANAQLLTNYSNEVCQGPQAYLNCTRCAVTRANQPALWAGTPLLTALLGWRGRLLKAAVAQADALIAPTNFVYQWHFQRDLIAKEIRVIKPGVEGFFIQEKQPQNERPIRFFYLGGISPPKGIHVALEAFGQLNGKAELWIAGDPTIDATYTAQLEALATPAVRFLGRLTRAEIAEILAQVEIFLAPSIWYETFCFVLHEAFSAGVPAIGSNLGAIAEGINHGVDGLLAEPNDVESWRSAMQRVVDNPAQIAHFQAGIHRPLSQLEHTRKILALYQEL